VNIARDKIPLWDKSRPKSIHSVLVQDTAKHRTKFGWLPLSDIAAERSQVAKPVEICWGAPNSPNRSQPLVSQCSPYCWDMRGDIAV